MNRICKKLFLSPYFFTIAIKKKENSIIKNMRFKSEYIVPANPKDWVADPIIIEDEGETYLFYEAVHNDKGRIEVAKIRDDCTLTKPVTIFEDEGHYSYPFVFKNEKAWYMIPETSCTKKVKIYEAVDFPYEWKLKSVLLKEKAVDTTVFTKNNQKILLTFLTCENSERVVPKVYEMEFVEGDICLKEIIWSKYDELKCRGAGPVFQDGDKLYRPAQVSQENCYGDKVAFYCIDNIVREYQEHLEKILEPEMIYAPGWNVDGLHTYSVSEKFEAIDIRCRKFELFKVFRILKSYIAKLR